MLITVATLHSLVKLNHQLLGSNLSVPSALQTASTKQVINRYYLNEWSKPRTVLLAFPLEIVLASVMFWTLRMFAEIFPLVPELRGSQRSEEGPLGRVWGHPKHVAQSVQGSAIVCTKLNCRVCDPMQRPALQAGSVPSYRNVPWCCCGLSFTEAKTHVAAHLAPLQGSRLRCNELPTNDQLVCL